MDYAYVFAGMFVSGVALFKRESLVQKSSFRIILAISAALFVAGFVIHSIGTDPGSACGALITPLLSLGLYRFCRRLFLWWVGHEPKDTYLNWAPGLGADRIFNIVYFGSVVWILLLTAGGMMELAKAGW